MQVRDCLFHSPFSPAISCFLPRHLPPMTYLFQTSILKSILGFCQKGKKLKRGEFGGLKSNRKGVVEKSIAKPMFFQAFVLAYTIFIVSLLRILSNFDLGTLAPIRDSIKSHIYFSPRSTTSLSLWPSTFPFQGKGYYYSTALADDFDSFPPTLVQDLFVKVEKDTLRERQQRIRVGLDTKDINAEAEEDYMGVGHLIQKLQKQKLRISPE